MSKRCTTYGTTILNHIVGNCAWLLRYEVRVIGGSTGHDCVGFDSLLLSESLFDSLYDSTDLISNKNY